MSNRPPVAQAQMSLAYPHLVPGDTVRWTSRGSWHFGVLVGLDGSHAVVATREGGRRERVLAAAVQPWHSSLGGTAHGGDSPGALHGAA